MTYIKSNILFEKISVGTIYESVPHPIIIADHLTTPDNMGALIRLSDNIGASEVIFLGKEPSNSLGRIRKCAASSRDNIKWHFTESNDLQSLIPKGKKIVAIETSDTAKNIYETALPSNAAFIVGNESHGIREEILVQCDITVFIPVPGPTRSLNVSHAAAVGVFEWQRQMLEKSRNDTRHSL